VAALGDESSAFVAQSVERTHADEPIVRSCHG
jgi:hypothetical protein